MRIVLPVRLKNLPVLTLACQETKHLPESRLTRDISRQNKGRRKTDDSNDEFRKERKDVDDKLFHVNLSFMFII